MNYRAALIALLAASPCMMGLKCIPNDPRFSSSEPIEEPATDAGTGPVDVVPSVACPEAGTAEILIQNFAFVILCGCEEQPWPMDADGSKSCTIAAGTTVKWTFADSEDHNVASEADSFASSGDRLVGSHSEAFSLAGTYEYKCGIHSRDMSGYSIVVK